MSYLGRDGQGRSRWRGLAVRLAMAGDGEDRRRRLLAVVLLALLLVAGALGIGQSVSTAHHQGAAGPRHAPAVLVGGGGVAPRPVSGDLSAVGSVGEVLFAEDGTAFDHNARQVISLAVQSIRYRHSSVVTVTGYTDAIGRASANQALSLRRVLAVIKILRQELGGGPGAVQYRPIARGQGQPVAPNSTAAGRQLNRRVVITAGVSPLPHQSAG